MGREHKEVMGKEEKGREEKEKEEVERKREGKEKEEGERKKREERNKKGKIQGFTSQIPSVRKALFLDSIENGADVPQLEAAVPHTGADSVCLPLIGWLYPLARCIATACKRRENGKTRIDPTAQRTKVCTN
jgi:hypothetical protein